MGHVGSKTRSQGQIFEKACARSRGHIFSPIIMNLGQNVCLDKISLEFRMGYVGLKTRSLGQILENLVYALEATFSDRLSWNLVRMFVFIKSRMSCKMVYVMSGQKLGH